MLNMKKYKVLHIMNGADRGGIQSVVLNYYRYIDREKFTFDIAIPIGEPRIIVPEIEKLGGTCYELPPKGRHPFAYIISLRKLIIRNDYDVVHVHQHSSCYFPLFVALLCGVKCRVAQSHSYMLGESVITKIKRYVGIILNNVSSNLRFACTNQAASHLFGKSRRLFPVTILPNGVESEKFSFSEQVRFEARKALNIESSELVLGIVGRMTPEKNHKYLLNVLSELLKIRKDAKLLLVGDGPLKSQLMEYSKQIGVADSAIFVGKRPDLLNMLCAMDVFALPSIYEGSPVSAVEAAANGLPVILSSSITKDLLFLNNVEYLGIDKNNSEQWALTVIELSKKGRDFNNVAIINKNGFNVKAIAMKLEESYLKKLH